MEFTVEFQILSLGSDSKAEGSCSFPPTASHIDREISCEWSNASRTGFRLDSDFGAVKSRR